MAGFLVRKNRDAPFIPQTDLPGKPESARAFSAFARGRFLLSSAPMKRRFEDKGPNFIFIGAAVLVLFGIIWLSCHQREFIDAFTAKATSGDYYHLLATVMEVVEVE